MHSRQDRSTESATGFAETEQKHTTSPTPLIRADSQPPPFFSANKLTAYSAGKSPQKSYIHSRMTR